MRTATRTALAAAVVLLSACGSTDSEPTAAGAESGEGGSAVTVSGADSAIVEDGDDRPADEADAASVVAVTVDVPDGVQLAGTAVVALEDITYSDAAAVEIASVKLPVAELLQRNNVVEVFLPLPLDGSVDVTATVHIDVDENGSFSPGDWISPELAMVTPAASAVTVIMVQI